jgi:hypothetical protein
MLAKALGGFASPLRIRLMLLLEDERSPTGLHQLVGELAAIVSGLLETGRQTR